MDEVPQTPAVQLPPTASAMDGGEAVAVDAALMAVEPWPNHWCEMLPVLLQLLETRNESARQYALGELNRMATTADLGSAALVSLARLAAV